MQGHTRSIVEGNDSSVTVAICTWNRSQLLQQTLDRLCHIEVPRGVRWELLIVDNNSTDETKDVVQAFATRLPIRYVCEVRPGAACARNRALDECASSDYVLFTDDDVWVDQGWLAAFLKSGQDNPAAAGIAGPIEPWFPHEPDRDLLAAFPVLENGFCGIDEADFVTKGCTSYTANLGFRNRMIEGLRFAEHLGPNRGFAGGGEDTVFCRAVLARGHAIDWSPAMRVRHYVDPSRMTLRYLLRWYRDNARKMVRVSGPPHGRSVLGVPLWSIRLWASSFLMQHWLTLRGRRTAALEHQRSRVHWAGTIEEHFSQRSGLRA